ncbi:DUF6083 domain-containing protein [Streptomyces sp. NRRL B-3229]|uniref:DUF6083 domain-containing protein n=1 Tax=Streptomyces sp. NRRL B-3229 TaxID=1463836 RepID=UPI002D21DEE9|nr:DUF6083 domain-containing protein [Streptomyces sp. NRRL B-3229]
MPEACRWHVSSGVAHPAGDGSRWCRTPSSAPPARHPRLLPSWRSCAGRWPCAPAA